MALRLTFSSAESANPRLHLHLAQVQVSSRIFKTISVNSWGLADQKSVGRNGREAPLKRGIPTYVFIRKKIFVISSATAGINASPITSPHSRRDGACVLKIGCRKGTFTTRMSNTMDNPTAYCM